MATHNQHPIIPQSISERNPNLLTAMDSLKQASLLFQTEPFSTATSTKIQTTGIQIFGAAYTSREPVLSLLEPGSAGACHLLNAIEALWHAGNEESVKRAKQLGEEVLGEQALQGKWMEMQDRELALRRREAAQVRWEEHLRRKREWAEFMEGKKRELEEMVAALP